MNELQYRALARLATLGQDEDGQTFAEYGLILALIVVIVAGVFGAFSGTLNGMFDAVAGALGGGGGE
ncbi:MAG: Flp family type IVb pilin [Actinomycetota bacterium]